MWSVPSAREQSNTNHDLVSPMSMPRVVKTRSAGRTPRGIEAIRDPIDLRSSSISPSIFGGV